MRMRLFGVLAFTTLAVGLLTLPVITVGEESEQKISLDELLKQRGNTLQQLVEAVTSEFRSGRVSYAVVAQARSRLIDAELELANSHQERIAFLKQQIEASETLFACANEGLRRGRVPQSEYLTAQADLLDAKIALAREQDESGTGQRTQRR